MSTFGFISIEEIEPSKVNVALRAKVLRMWTQKGYGFDKDELIIEVILGDEKGHKIGMHVTPNQRVKFQKLLKEDGNYIFKDVVVVDNKFPSVHSPHNYKLMCNFKSSAIAVSQWSGAPTRFDLVPFEKFTPETIAVGISVDLIVIGWVTVIGQMKPWTSETGNDSKYLTIRLQDIAGVNLTCTLWGEFADQFMAAHDKNDSCGFMVVLLKNGKTSKYRESVLDGETMSYRDTIQVTTDWYATQVLVNTTEPVITEFRSSLHAIHAIPELVSTLGPAVTMPHLTPNNYLDDCKHFSLDEIQPSMFMVDAYTLIESERLSYIRLNQGNLMSETYNNLVKSENEGNTETEPDEVNEPELCNLVPDIMMHGPCGAIIDNQY